MSKAPKVLARTAKALDDRVGLAPFAKKALRKAFPDHWDFLMGEIALYSFAIVLLTGVYLALFFVPSMNEVLYQGSYRQLRGLHMSEAYASALNISLEVRGGLLVRQIHHWATILFLSSITVHMLRNFFTGAFRKPRDINWVIGVVLFMLVLVNGLFGYSLPDDLLSGTGMRIFAGVLLAIPVVGTYVYMFFFGGEFPGEMMIPRLYTIHILLIPGILLALIPLHAVVLTWRHTHTQYPGLGSTDRTVRGYPFFPVFVAKTIAFFLWVLGATVLLATFFQINPIWLFGPYDPAAISAGSQPDWYMGFMEGALRLMPSWGLNLWGHTIELSVVIPALLVPGALFVGLAVYPFIERWITGDTGIHHALDRPRDVPFRTGLGVAGCTFYGLLWIAGGNDLIAKTFNVPLYGTTWFLRFAVFIGPVIAYIVAYRICLGLQRHERHLVEHGVETGTIKLLPNGAYVEVLRRPTKEDLAPIIETRRPPAVPIDAPDVDGVEHPAHRRLLAKIRIKLNQRFRADLGPPRIDDEVKIPILKTDHHPDITHPPHP
ncbi:MAG TPA: ubiquinol-cytochrome c reductase cytochrome b subunit [Actinomadura sp.]|jgi:ubiquinol-cytochrome c reductase cytochrome b subunit|nr:ubiquinol-cytochrome c reductase cytochrome b subunit [Actinomadura sp.]